MTREFSKRTTAVFVVAIIAGTALTIQGTYYALKTFVLDNPNDPLVQQVGGLSSAQRHGLKAKK